MNDDEEFYGDEEAEQPDEEVKKLLVKLVPTLDYFQKNYGRSMEGNDQKAVRVFRDYEPNERLRRLQHELQLLKENGVSEEVLDIIVGKKRKMKYQGYDKWAAMMLMWIVSKK